MLLFFVLLLPCLGVVCWNEIVEEKGDTTFGTMSAIGQAMAQFVIFMGAVALFVVEGSNVRRAISEATRRRGPTAGACTRTQRAGPRVA